MPKDEPINNDKFVEWLDEALASRSINKQRLSALMGAKPALIGNMVNNKSRLTWELAARIAEALGLPASLVLIEAGLLKREEVNWNVSEEQQEIVTTYQQLNPERRKALIAYIRFERDRQREANSRGDTSPTRTAKTTK